MNTHNRLSLPALLITMSIATAPLGSMAQDGSGRSAKEDNPGYLHGGLNILRGGAGTSHTGYILGMGSEFYFGNYVGDDLRFGLNMGWFSVAGHFYEGGGTGVELQAIKPGFLFSADLSEEFRLDLKYSAMPTARGYLSNADEDASVSWGVAHGPYFGIKYNKFAAGVEYVLGSLRHVDDDSDRIIRTQANTLRILIGFNY